MRRCKLRLTYAELHQALRLAADVRVMGVYTATDPDLVFVVCEADWFNDSPDHTEAPFASVEYVR